MATLYRNCHLATFTFGAYGEVHQAALVVDAGRVVWLGPEIDLPPAHHGAEAIDCEGRWITPGLIDCHTHLVYGGNRAHEFEARLLGATYAEIAAAGGGIVSTVKATREASEEALYAAAAKRLRCFVDEGVTTIELKSGYGLDLASERKLLRVARRLRETFPISCRATFLGAHAVPPEFRGQPNAYIDCVVDEMLPALAAEGLIDAVDAFCETVGFSPDQVERVFRRAHELDLPVKLHAEQLSDQGGAALVARYQGLSADHLEWLSPAGIVAMKAAGTVAVMLPAAYYFLRDTQLPPIEALRAAGVPMAVATDCNPGTAPVTSLLAALNMACVIFRLTPAEALAGATRHAATALGYADRGRLAPGLRADLAIWDVGHPAELAYHLGYNPLWKRVWAA